MASADAQKKLIANVGSRNVPSSSNFSSYRGISKNKKSFLIEFINDDGSNTTLPSGNGDEPVLGVKFMINPASLSVNMSKLISRTPTMTGWVEEHWGEELDTITFQGSTAAFVLGGRTTADTVKTSIIQRRRRSLVGNLNAFLEIPYDPQTAATANFVGLTTKYRKDSVSYKEFKNFINIMHTNGAIFNSDGLVGGRKSIQLTYDYSSYLGYFDSLDVTEDANSPFRYIYTATFKAEKTIYSFSPRAT